MQSNLKPFAFPRSFDPGFWREYDYSPFSGGKSGYDWNPFASFRRETSRLFNDFSRAPAFGGYDQAEFTGYWPTLEFKETDDELIVTAEVPGMNEKDVELYFDKGILTIRGYKKQDKDEAGYSERFYGRFERQLPLPHSVDAQHCSATFQDGLLTVRFAKLAEVDNKKKIPINATPAAKGRKHDVVHPRQPEFVGA